MKRILVTIAFATSITLLLPSSAYADESSVVVKEWKSYVDPLAPLAEHAAALAPGEHDEQWRQNLYGFLFSQSAVTCVGRLYADPKYPNFAPMINQIFNQGFPNPDDSYYHAGHHRLTDKKGEE